MKCAPVVAFISICLLQTAFAAPPATQSLEHQLAIHKAQEQQEYLKQLNDDFELKLPHAAVADLFDLTIDDAGMLALHPKIQATNTEMRCTIKGLAGPCSVTAFAGKPPAGGLVALQFSHHDFSNDQEIFRNTTLFAYKGSVQLSTDLDGLIQSRDVSLIQNLNSDEADSAIELYAQEIDPVTDGTIAKYHISAKSFRELRQQHPRETQQFVVPILRELQCQAILAPDPRVAYQVFQTQFKPDAVLTKKIDTALAKFDADDFQVREEASHDLDSLGQPAALTLVNADRKAWSIDRASGVDTFLSKYKALPLERIKDLKSNPGFLLDSLYSTDPQIRAGGAAALESMVKQKIDVSATGGALDQTIDRVATILFPPLPTQPTSQP